MSVLISIEEFFRMKNEIPLVDVRSPGEYEQGHIPGAINIPLFDNEERAIVGTLFKQSGQQEAVLAGLEIAGRKMRQLAEMGIKTARNKQLTVHCWRGGMRSASVAWLFETCGVPCSIIEGGYKSYRRYIRECFSLPFDFIVLGGMTGSGKSAILDRIEELGYQVLKLEKIAHHKGSAFGNLGETGQMTNEQFENDIFTSLFAFDPKKPVFVEDESRSIGRNIIPPELFENMSIGTLLVVDMEKSLRVGRLVEDYGKYTSQDLKDCIAKIGKRLGGQNAKTAIDALDEGKTGEAVEICLNYYDKTYNYGLSNKRNREIVLFKTSSPDADVNANGILSLLKTKGLV